ncbi:hypothetical protein EUGRSUZ_G00029 [Eucalyptus grandis]|uniref:Uncharacterized protein n=2 Tax=Eucalyptus grandis TaxID=71139 RepID=A0ACC3K0M1_EUCGR|nr:hypothetical protein EUGRSUZ_G00029 [Eucalyptus grandis]
MVTIIGSYPVESKSDQFVYTTRNKTTHTQTSQGPLMANPTKLQFEEYLKFLLGIVCRSNIPQRVKAYILRSVFISTAGKVLRAIFSQSRL